MAKIDYIHRDMIEDLFEMRGGYVLNFNNEDFEAFIEEVLGYKVYSMPQYCRLSKAKILRAIIKEEKPIYVGKLLVELTNYMQYKNLIKSSNIHTFNKIKELGVLLMGKSTTKPVKEENKSKAVHRDKNINLDAVKDALLKIDDLLTQQKKGYAFEEFLTDLLDKYGLNPRSSYKTEYDQIDGSFQLQGLTVLMEAKYRKTAPSKDDLILFQNKLSHTSTITRGVFITLSPVDVKTIEYYQTIVKNFIVLTVEELFLMCLYNISLIDLLCQKFRKLDETGMIFVHLLTLDLKRGGI